MLTVTNLSYKIGNRFILNDLSLSFCPGKLHLVLGANGAGKSTLVKLLSNHNPQTKGRVIYGNRKLEDLTVAELARTRAVLSQNIELSFPLTVEEVVMMGRYPHFSNRPGSKDLESVEASMELFDVGYLAKRNYLTLSGGEKQRVHFARVISQIWYSREGVCRYLFLDEPLSFLDIYYQYDFLRKLKCLLDKGDLVVVGVIHDLNLAGKFADQVVVLGGGKLIRSGDKISVLNTETIRKAYRMEANILEQEGEVRVFFE